MPARKSISSLKSVLVVPTTSQREGLRSIAAIAAAVFLFVVAPRLLVLPLSVIDWDESIYLLVARDVLSGVLPYEGAFDHKPVGIYFLFALFIAIFGETIVAIRILALLAVALTSIMLAALARRIFELTNFGLFTVTALYGLLTIGHGGLATNTEIIVNFFLVSAFFFLTFGELDRRVSLKFGVLCGISLGLAFQINYLAGFLILGFATYYAVILLDGTSPVGRVRRLLVNGVIIFASFLISFFLLLAPLALWGDVSNYSDLQWRFISGYGRGEMPATEKIHVVLQVLNVYIAYLSLVPVAIALALMTRVAPESSASNGGPIWIFGLAWSSYVLMGLFAATASGHYYDHYFLLLVPGFTMLSAWALWVFSQNEQTRFVMASYLMVIAMVGSLWAGNILLAGGSATVRVIAGGYPDELAKVSAKIAGSLAPGEMIYVYDADHVHYFLVGSPLPTRFAFRDHHLNESYSKRLGFTPVDEMNRILAQKPRFVIAGSDPVDGHYGPPSDVLAEHLDSFYRKTEWSYFRKSRKVQVFERFE